MPSVTRSRIRALRLNGERSAPADGEASEDPDALIKIGESIQRAFERLAHRAANNAMRSVFREMAEAYRRANKDVGLRWRDVNG